jgi:hypothetical protein|tara:strand:+ start:9277 stop:10164 length:888 start_codon:yes stop_codon:yes gene_type:complete
MAVRQILPEQTLETLRLEFNALAADDFGDIGTLDSSMSATTVIGAVNELAGQIFSAAGWKMEDATSTVQTVGAGQTARFLGTSNQINAVVSVPDILTMSLTDDVSITTSVSAPTVNAGNLTLSSGYITDSSGYVNFDNENIQTTAEVSGGTGTFGTVVGTGGTHTLGTIQVSGNQISSTDSTELIINDSLRVLGNILVNQIGTLSGDQITISNSLLIGQNKSIFFEGATNDSFETNLTVVDPTSDQIVSLPDATGTVALTNTTGYATGSIFTASVSLVIYNSAGVAQKTIVGSAS